jgi:hypothetical protein
MKKFLAPAFLAIMLLPTSVSAVELTNPLGTSDIRLVIARLIKGVIGLTGAVVFLMVIYGGILWLTSMGNPEQVNKGKRVLIWAILGFAVIASAYVITDAIVNAILTGSVAG